MSAPVGRIAEDRKQTDENAQPKTSAIVENVITEQSQKRKRNHERKRHDQEIGAELLQPIQRAQNGAGPAGGALLVGIVIYCVYRRFYTGVVYSRSFAVTLVGMCVLTCMVTLAISTNIVISLGMVGALSIVRYRTAVKDPMDLLYLFWAITSGIAAGAGMYLLVVVAGAVMIGMLALFYSHQDKGRVYIAVIHYASDAVGDDITRAFGRTKFFVKSKTMRGDHVEMAVEVFCDDKDMTFAERIRAIEGVEDVTLIQYNGEYHG